MCRSMGGVYRSRSLPSGARTYGLAPCGSINRLVCGMESVRYWVESSADVTHLRLSELAALPAGLARSRPGIQASRCGDSIDQTIRIDRPSSRLDQTLPRLNALKTDILRLIG